MLLRLPERSSGYEYRWGELEMFGLLEMVAENIEGYVWV